MIFAAMEKYSIPSVQVFKRTWTRAQLYLANDAAFWNAPKDAKRYSKITAATDWSKIPAAEAFAMISFSLSPE